MRSGAPVLHDYAPDNVTKHIPIRVGDVDKGFAESDLVVEETYSTQAIEHAYLEPEAGLAYVDHDGVVTIVSPDQNVTHHRHMHGEKGGVGRLQAPALRMRAAARRNVAEASSVPACGN